MERSWQKPHRPKYYAYEVKKIDEKIGPMGVPWGPFYPINFWTAQYNKLFTS